MPGQLDRMIADWLLRRSTELKNADPATCINGEPESMRIVRGVRKQGRATPILTATRLPLTGVLEAIEQTRKITGRRFLEQVLSV